MGIYAHDMSIEYQNWIPVQTPGNLLMASDNQTITAFKNCNVTVIKPVTDFFNVLNKKKKFKTSKPLNNSTSPRINFQSPHSIEYEIQFFV